jgi:hypothetical protein
MVDTLQSVVVSSSHGQLTLTLSRYLVSILLAAQILFVISLIMWLRRVFVFRKTMKEREIPLHGHLWVRAFITCAMALDDPLYTIVRYAAASFLFLGGIQLHFRWTLLAMLLTYTASATAETARIVIAFLSTPSLKSLVVAGDGMLAAQMRGITTQLNPSSVYEDIGRGKTITFMVFITQAILISIVVRFRSSAVCARLYIPGISQLCVQMTTTSIFSIVPC